MMINIIVENSKCVQFMYPLIGWRAKITKLIISLKLKGQKLLLVWIQLAKLFVYGKCSKILNTSCLMELVDKQC